MNLKRISAVLLALAMTLSVAAFAAESETPNVVVDNDIVREVNHDQGDISLLSAPAGGGFGAGGLLAIPIAIAKNYTTTITVNGEPLEEYTFEKNIAGSWEYETITTRLTDLPAVPDGYVPMRAVAQADPNCYVDWFKESNMSRFVLIPYTVEVNFLDMSVTVDGEVIEGAVAILDKGTTFLPVSVFDYLEGYDVEDTSADGMESYAITTPYGRRTPLEMLAEDLMETADMGMGMKATAEDLEIFWGESYGFTADMLEEFYVSLPMMISPDTLIIGKIAEGQEEAFAAVLNAYIEAQANTFSYYMSHNLPKVEDARFVTEGDWFLFLIGANADEVVEQFRANVSALDEAEA